MPWRLAPRAAYSLGLLGMVGLTVSASLTRSTPESASDTADGARTLGCARVGGDAWSPLPGVEYTGALRLELPAAAGAAMMVIVGDDVPLDLEARTAAAAFPFTRTRLRRGPGIGVPPDLWLESGVPWDVPGELVRLTFDARADRAATIDLMLGRRAPRVLARIAGYDESVRTQVCAVTPVAGPGVGDRSLEIGPADAAYFGTGWLADVRDQGVVTRPMRDHGALFIPSTHDGAVSIRLRAAPAATDAPLTLSLRVNDLFDGGAVAMSAEAADYEWSIPAHAWVAGINELLFSVSGTAAVTDIAGRRVRLRFERLSVTKGDLAATAR
jgi:hypothetical protein